MDADRKGGFARSVDYAIECEKLGVDVAWSAEGLGAPTRSRRWPIWQPGPTTMRLASGIAQVSARAPGNIAMAAPCLWAAMSENRFMLGLGVSGPQVVEGLHGVPFCTSAGAHEGTGGHPEGSPSRARSCATRANTMCLPLPGGEGKALRLGAPAECQHSDLSGDPGAEGAGIHGGNGGRLASAPRSRPRRLHRTWSQCGRGAVRAGTKLR